MSLRRFLGWEPAEVTDVVEYDDQGRAKRWRTRREPEWDDGQRLWMLALAHYEAGMCRKCGHHLDDSTDPDTNPDNPHATRQWVAEVPTECLSCKVLARSERKWAEDEKNVIPTEALIHTAVLVAKKPRKKRARKPAETT